MYNSFVCNRHEVFIAESVRWISAPSSIPLFAVCNSMLVRIPVFLFITMLVGAVGVVGVVGVVDRVAVITLLLLVVLMLI